MTVDGVRSDVASLTVDGGKSDKANMSNYMKGMNGPEMMVNS